MRVVNYPCHHLAELAYLSHLARIRIDSRNELSSYVLTKGVTSFYDVLRHYTRRLKHPVMQLGISNVQFVMRDMWKKENGYYI